MKIKTVQPKSVYYFKVFNAASLSLKPKPGTVSGLSLSSFVDLVDLLELLAVFCSIQSSNTAIAALMLLIFSSAFVTANNQIEQFKIFYGFLVHNQHSKLESFKCSLCNTRLARPSNPRTVNF